LCSPVEGFEQQYKVAAAEGAIVELKMLLLADKVPELQKYAHDNTLGAIGTLIGTHFSAFLPRRKRQPSRSVVSYETKFCTVIFVLVGRSRLRRFEDTSAGSPTLPTNAHVSAIGDDTHPENPI
jgi:hypothetical protein